VVGEKNKMWVNIEVQYRLRSKKRKHEKKSRGEDTKNWRNKCDKNGWDEGHINVGDKPFDKKEEEGSCRVVRN